MNPSTLVTSASLISSLLIPMALAYVFLFYAFAWNRPWLALLLIFALPPFQTDLSGGDSGAKFSIAEINLLLSLPLLLVARGRKWHLGPIALPVFLYLFISLISSVLNPRDSTLTSMLQMVLYLVVTVLVFSTLARDERDYMPALKALVWVGILFSLLSLSGIYERFGLNKNGIGASLTGCLIVCCELWFGAKTMKEKTMWALALGLIAVGLFMTLSRGAWLGAGIGLVVLCAIRGQYRLLLRVSIVAVPLFLLVWAMLPQKSKTYASGFDTKKNYNIMLRYKSLDYAQDNFEKSPVLGVGVGLRKEYDATNVLMLTLAETGVVGLVAFSLIHLVLLSMIWKSKKKLRRDDPLFPFVALAGALIASRLAHGMVDHYWSRGAITSAWASVGMATYVFYALRQRARNEKHLYLEYQRALHENTRELPQRQPRFATFAQQSSTRLGAAPALPAPALPLPNATIRDADTRRDADA